jgi:hypothetical protein
MRAQDTRLQILSLEERSLPGSYFGAPTGAGGAAGPLALIPQGTASLALVKATGGYHHADLQGTRNEPSHAAYHPHHFRALLPSDGSAGQTGTTGGNSVVDVGPALPDDPTWHPISTDLGLGVAEASSTNLDGSGGGTGSGGDAGAVSAAGSVVASGGIGTTAPLGTGAIASMPVVSANLIAASVGQNLAVVNASGQTGFGNDAARSDGLVIPRGHPRVWFNDDPQRIAQAQAYYAQHPLNPSSTDGLGNALVYVLTGDTTAAQNAVTALMNFTISEGELQSVASDNYRWSDWVPVTYDWVHDAMTPDQIQTFTDRYNYYTSTVINKSWGGPGMPDNNFFWGYFENELNWAIASYYDNPMAQTFLDDALITRWQNNFVPWTNGPGRGGVEKEGTEYGKVDLSYPSLALTTAALMGGDQYTSTNFYKEAIFNQIYATSPAPTYSNQSPTNPYYMPFPFGEEEHDGGYPNINDSASYGDFMQAAANAYSNLPVGQYAYHYLQTVQPPQTYYTLPNYLNTPTYQSDMVTSDFSQLPVDYYAPGAGYFYTRNQWGPQATSIFLQLSGSGTPHANLDDGSFQIWRNGWFLSKETTGYLLQINGGMSEDPIAHNTILFGGRGIAPSWRASEPQVIRLQSDPAFSYAAVDMSGAFQSSWYPTLSNPYAGTAIREFIFIKPLETMVVLDRMQASSAAEPADQVTKTFLLHFPNQPTVIGPHTVEGTSGNQVLRLTTLVPGNVNYNVVDESNFSGPHDPDPAFYQYRLEATTSGSAQSYFINVLQAHDTNGSNVVTHMTQDSTSWTITLDHPTLGHAEIVLNKGTFSTGGAVGYSTTGIPTQMTPLLDHVQDIQVTDSGPVWGN